MSRHTAFPSLQELPNVLTPHSINLLFVIHVKVEYLTGISSSLRRLSAILSAISPDVCVLMLDITSGPVASNFEIIRTIPFVELAYLTRHEKLVTGLRILLSTPQNLYGE